jgi:hypothetical protein
MLKSVDILIGLSLVMLVVSMAVTLMTQALVSIRQSRGRHLMRGLSDLLEQLHPGITADIAKELSEAVLKHPLIRGSEKRLGSVIRREELTKLLLGFAAIGQPSPETGATFPEPDKPEDILRMVGTRLSQGAQTALLRALTDNGIRDPKQTLANVRMLALQLERTNPELATTARHNLAIMHEASSDFVAKLNGWFDQTMDRVSERFTFSTRVLTFISAAIVACALQLDTVALVNRLSMDDNMRNALVQEAVALKDRQDAAPTAAPEPPAQNPEERAKMIRDYYEVMAQAGVLRVPGRTWLSDWKDVSFPGLVISTLLLSLGAPFWYNALNRLLQLRSALARKDDIDRKDRESTMSSVATPVGPAQAQPAVLAGERGDLAAMG